jgi:hypothetical protein
MSDLPDIAECPHCNNSGTLVKWQERARNDGYDFSYDYRFVKCLSCYAAGPTVKEDHFNVWTELSCADFRREPDNTLWQREHDKYEQVYVADCKRKAIELWNNRPLAKWKQEVGLQTAPAEQEERKHGCACWCGKDHNEAVKDRTGEGR